MEVIIALLVIAGFIIASFFEITIFSAPGVFIRRLFLKRKKSFKELYKEHVFLNYFLGLLVIFIIFIAIALVVKLFS
jgi:hypothetical protein